jgi:hypothetical protein
MVDMLEDIRKKLDFVYRPPEVTKNIGRHLPIASFM